jgi:hypothetical protein
MRVSRKKSGFVTADLVGIIATLLRWFNVEEINETMVDNGKSMMATKVGSLKFRVIQVLFLE